jgi:hypothetical protein
MPELQVKVEDLQKNRIFLATPCYGGMCGGMFARSVADLSALCTHYRIPLQIYFLFNESLITRARNYACDEFMRSGASHLLFIDADIGFSAQDVLGMLALQRDESPFDIIGAPYPKKTISWEKIVVAVNKGMADENPNNLEKYVGDYVFNPKANTTSIPLNEPVEVLEIGTGFMMVKRQSMQHFYDNYPQYLYKPDHVRTEHFDGSREILQFFQAEIDPVSKRYLSEDYWFCQKAQAINLKTWFCPWVKLTHTGTYVFGGSLQDLASIQVHATADGDLLKKARENQKKSEEAKVA